MATTTPAAPSRAARSHTRPAQAASVWSGWIGFAAITVLVVAAVNVFEGLIAVIRDQYFVVVGNQVIVFDLTTWGWITLIWGAVFGLAAFALAARRSWARWLTIVLASVNVVAQLGFLGSTQYPLWTLVAVALDVLVLFALTARWERDV